MIRKRAKPERVEALRELLCQADIMLCKAAMTNVLTGTADRRLCDLIFAVRRFADDTDRSVEDRP